MPDRIADLRRLYDEEQLQDAWHLYLETPCQSAEWHNLGCKVALQLDLIHAARAAVEHALALNPEGDQRALAHFLAGEINRRIGDLSVAREQFAACLDALENAPTLSPVLRGPCLYNQAFALYSSGLRVEALASNEAALMEFTRENFVSYQQMALVNTAWYAADVGQWGRALTALGEAEPLSESGMPYWTYMLSSAYVYHSQGNNAEAMAYLKLILDAMDRTDDVEPEIGAMATAIAADIALQGEDAETAHLLATYAYDLAWKEPRDQRCMTFTARILSKVNKAKRKGA